MSGTIRHSSQIFRACTVTLLLSAYYLLHPFRITTLHINICLSLVNWRWGNANSKVTKLGADNWGIMILPLARARDFSLPQSNQTGSGGQTQPPIQWVLEEKVAGCEARHLPTSSATVMREGSCMTTPTHAFLRYKGRENCILLLILSLIIIPTILQIVCLPTFLWTVVHYKKLNKWKT